MAGGGLTITRDDRGDLVVLTVHGELDRAGADKLLADAAARDLEDGDEVEIGNERGTFRARLVVGATARRGVAATTKGHWPKLLAGGANVNAVTEERDADIGGGAVFHDCSVWVRAVAGVATGATGSLAAWPAAG